MKFYIRNVRKFIAKFVGIIQVEPHEAVAEVSRIGNV